MDNSGNKFNAGEIYWHCKSCGKDQNKENISCENCGMDLFLYGERKVKNSTLPPSPPPPPPPPPPYKDDDQSPPPTYKEDDPPLPPPPPPPQPKKKKKKALKIVLGIVIGVPVLLAGVLVAIGVIIDSNPDIYDDPYVTTTQATERAEFPDFQDFADGSVTLVNVERKESCIKRTYSFKSYLESTEKKRITDEYAEIVDDYYDFSMVNHKNDYDYEFVYTGDAEIEDYYLIYNDDSRSQNIHFDIDCYSEDGEWFVNIRYGTGLEPVTSEYKYYE